MYDCANKRVQQLLTQLNPSSSSCFACASANPSRGKNEEKCVREVNDDVVSKMLYKEPEIFNNSQNKDSELYEVLIIGAGVTGICQLYHLARLGFHVILLDKCAALGGTWFNNRYPGCRFDSESYTYGFSFSREVIEEWSWSEHFTGQPENLQYLEFVAKKFGLEKFMHFNADVTSASFDETRNTWIVRVASGKEYKTRFLVTGVGCVTVPTVPRIPGMESFKGLSFHTYNWPHTPLDLKNMKVAVIGTGPSGMQLISTIADKVTHLTVFQKKPIWSAPLNNACISANEMSEIRLRMDSILVKCTSSPTYFMHQTDPRSFYKISHEERVEFWNRLWAEPGFGIWLANFPDIFNDPSANAEFCDFVATKIRARINDPKIAEKLIPKNQAFGARRVVLETNYYEAYNRENVYLVDLNETPIQRISPVGIQTTAKIYDVDMIVYATGFDSFTGSYDKIDFRGVGGQRLQDKWKDDVATHLGIQVHGFPNLFMAPGPQGAGGSVNWTRAAETMVEYITNLLDNAKKSNISRIEPSLEAEQKWTARVKSAYKFMPFMAEGPTTGYNSNIEGRERGKIRHVVSFLGATQYAGLLKREEKSRYKNLSLL